MSVAKPQTASIIDTLSAGYVALNRRLWIVLIPIVVNLYFVFGAPVTIVPIIEQLRSLIATSQQIAAQDGSTVPPGLQLNESIEHVDMRQPLLWLHMLPLLERNAVLGQMNTDFAVTISADTSMVHNDSGDAIVVGNVLSLLVVFVALNLAGLLLSGLFLQQVVQAVSVTQRVGTGRAQVIQWAQLVGRILLWAALITLALLVVSVPFFIVATIAALVVPPVSALIFLLWVVALFWARIYIGFAIEAMAMDGVGPLRAIGNSFSLVRRNFFATLGFLILLGVIGAGLGLVWQQISSTTLGVVFACVASAYIGSGLAAARMLFYRQRWHSSRPAAA